MLNTQVLLQAAHVSGARAGSSADRRVVAMERQVKTACRITRRSYFFAFCYHYNPSPGRPMGTCANTAVVWVTHTTCGSPGAEGTWQGLFLHCSPGFHLWLTDLQKPKGGFPEVKALSLLSEALDLLIVYLQNQ